MTKLKRALGISSLTFYGVGLIIGAGIYSVIGAAAGVAREGLWLSFVLGAVVAGLTGLSYAELATTFPKAGAEYIYARNVLPQQQWVSFAIGFVLVVAGSATAATVSLAFAGYLNLFVTVPVILMALVLIIAATVLNILGIEQASRVNVIFTLIEVLGLILVIGAGLTTGRLGEAVNQPLHSGILAGAAILFFVYLGFEEIANLAEEVKHPGRDIPRSIFLSLGITTVLYVLVGLTVVILVSPEELAGSESPLSTAAAALSPTLATGLGLIALFATSNTVLTTLIATSRMLFSMGRGGDMPSFLARILPRRQSPWLAAVVVMVAAGLFLPFGEVAAVASLSSFASLIAFVAVNLMLVILRFRDPERERPFRVPLSIGRLPLLPVLGIVAAVVLAVQFDRQVYLVGVVVLIIGIGLYFGRRFWTTASPNAPAE